MSASSSCPTRASRPWPRSSSPNASPRHRRVRRHRRPGGRRAKGEGLGNQFLSHIRETDAIVNVVRCFEDPNVIHVNGKVDPIADIEVIQTELAWPTWPPSRRPDRYNKVARRRQGGQRPGRAARKLPGRAGRSQAGAQHRLQQGRAGASWPLCLITAKPAMFVGNVAEDGFENNPFLDRLREYAAAQNGPVVPSAPRPRPNGRHGRRGPRRSWPRWARTSRPEPPDPRRPSSCSACRPTSPPA